MNISFVINRFCFHCRIYPSPNISILRIWYITYLVPPNIPSILGQTWQGLLLGIELRSKKVWNLYSVSMLSIHGKCFYQYWFKFLISVQFAALKVLLIFTAFFSTLTLAMKLGVQAKTAYITGKLTYWQIYITVFITFHMLNIKINK